MIFLIVPKTSFMVFLYGFTKESERDPYKGYGVYKENSIWTATEALKMHQIINIIHKNDFSNFSSEPIGP